MARSKDGLRRVTSDWHRWNCASSHYGAFGAQATSTCFPHLRTPQIYEAAVCGRRRHRSLSLSPADTSHEEVSALSEAIIQYLPGPSSFSDDTAVIHYASFAFMSAQFRIVDMRAPELRETEQFWGEWWIMLFY